MDFKRSIWLIGVLLSVLTAAAQQFTLSGKVSDEEGNALTEVYKMEGLTRTTTYTYDRQARKMTSLTVLEYTAVG